VPEKLEAAHALVLGSTWPENAPLTVLEALAAGRPVVAPRIGGIPEQLRDGEGGLLYDPRDPLGLPAALRRLTSEPALIERLAASIRPPVSAGAHALEVEAVYAAVTPGGRP
jgi:glycosyltransferase involved in cell wall biosynthesis